MLLFAAIWWATGVVVAGCFAPQILDFLKDNYSAPDPRSEEEKSRYAAEWRRQDRERWHGKGAFDTMVNRSAFRLYRKLERFLARKGLAPQERPMWFGTENEPR